MEEVWKSIEGYPNYQVSNFGNVRRVKMLKQYYDESKGYNVVCLSKNGNSKVVKVHQLVAKAFIPNPDSKSEIDHIDTNRTNNCVDNLRWVTRKENLNNPLTTLNSIKAQRKVMKPVVQMTKEGYFKQIYRSQAYAGKMNGKSQTLIYAYCNKKANCPSGDKWELLENIDFLSDLPIVGRCSYISTWV